jgi:cytochrome c peroxidase
MRPMTRFASAVFGALFALFAHGAWASCPGYSVCPVENLKKIMASPPAQAVQANIDSTEAAALQAAQANGLTPAQELALMGEVLVFDRSLSVNGVEACALCHTPATGFAGGISALAKGGGIFPGAVLPRTGNRNPQSLAYSAFSPVLSYDAGSQTFTGGNFWDSRATGLITGSPAADQAMAPLTNPAEMGLPDPACAVRRVSLATYASLFTGIWGTQTLDITWPKNTDKICAKPNDNGANQTPLALSESDRAQATTTTQDIGLTIAAFEASTIASPFTSKYDAVQAGTASFTNAEAAGLGLFRGRGECSNCHSFVGSNPLFTSFTSFNIGVPRNPALAYLNENVADKAGYIANPAGPGYVDEGLGGFLNSAANTNKKWQAQAPLFIGTFQVSTLRNVAAKPAGKFTRAYTHNGFFTSLKMLVHFYNTRDVLPQCTGNTGIGVTCWPAPEQPANENTQFVGNLGLTEKEENQIVTFLGTLTDGYQSGQ